MTAAEIPPIVLLVDPHRESLEQYARRFEDAGLWVAATTAFDELLPSVEELHPDIIIADADADADAEAAARRRAALAAVKHDPTFRVVPLMVLVPSTGQDAPDADVTLRKPVHLDLLLRRTRDILAHAHDLRGRSNAIVSRTRTLIERSDNSSIRRRPSPPLLMTHGAVVRSARRSSTGSSAGPSAGSPTTTSAGVRRAAVSTASTATPEAGFGWLRTNGRRAARRAPE